MLFLLRSFALFIAPDDITGIGIAQSRHCNVVFCSFVLRIDSLKPFLRDHAITCGTNGLNSFICLRCNTTIVNIGRKARFYHKLPFMTKQRCSWLRLPRDCTRSSGSLIPVLPLLTWHQIRCSQMNLWCFVDTSDVDWVVVFVFRICSHFRTKIS